MSSVISSGVSHLDGEYRQWLLDKIRVLGTTIKDTETLGEEVARLLVRAHYYEKLLLKHLVHSL